MSIYIKIIFIHIGETKRNVSIEQQQQQQKKEVKNKKCS